ncbi:MAG: DNA topoisomerase III [Proteobacteria bacterium]|nr:DNA topoisomerase III [Pseudomonadota bacterium]
MTEKILIIAEKPSVAADLVKSLPGKFVKEKTHFEGDTYVVSYAIGHLVTICFPEEIDPAYQKWDMNNLPILPQAFPLKSLDGTKSQLSALQKLIRRKDIRQIINACDAGREGELIFKYIIKFVWNTSVAEKSFKRLWLQSMTADAIRAAFASLRDNAEMLPLEDTALCRSESDWLIGINATRALTGYNSRKGGFFLTPCGRVQTPTLSLLVKRERIRLSFVAKPYWSLQGQFTCKDQVYEGKWIDADFSRETSDSHDKADRIWTKDGALAIIAKCTGKPTTVEEQSKKNTQNSPQLYDLTLLQREANSRFGFSAKNTLSIAQSLYERHKILTYPRTDSKHLPEDYLQTVNDVLQRQTAWQFGAFAQEALNKKYVHPDKRIFNNSKISDHHAIIPTSILPTRLTEPEAKIYQMVVQRFLAVFFPPAVFLNTKRVSMAEGETFLTEGKILLEAGWKAIYGNASGDGQDRTLAPVPSNALVRCSEISISGHETTPPPRFNEATLLSAMENSDKLVEDEELADAMKERGLGTPATRAAIIEKLIKEKYVVREGKDLTPTGKAFELLALLEAMQIEVLASPEMTGEWEYKLNRMLKGQFTRDKFMAEIRAMTEQIIHRVKNFEKGEIRAEAPFSPVNGVRFFSSPTAFVSEDKKISIRKILGGRMLTEDEVVALLHGKTIGPFSDFRSKKGKPFTASVRLIDTKIEFIFASSIDELDIDAVKQGPILGLSPIDQTKVFATPMAYMSESALNGDVKKGLKISKTILSKEVCENNIRQLLSEGKTELIAGFISKKKKPFDAYLLLAKNGTLSFDFPPRKEKSPKQNTLTVSKKKGTTNHETD